MVSSGSGHCRLRGRWVVLVTVVFAVAEAPVRSHAEWAAIAEEKTSYTTDVFQFSSARRLALTEDPSQPTIVPLNKQEDVIWEPSVEVIQSSSNSLGRNDLSIKAHGYIYTNNPIFNHGEYRLQDRQSLGPDTSMLLRYRYVPNLFLGPNFERRTGTRSIQEERVTSHQWRAELERRLAEQWTAVLVGRYGLRLYNEAFAERDTTFYGAGPRIEYRPTHWTSLTLGYLYERGLADGRDEIQFADDVSYYLNMLSVGTELRLTARVELNLVYLYLRKTFTSGLAGDSHVDRRDSTHQGLAEVRYHVTPVAMVTLGFQHTQRASTNALRNFNDTIVSIGGEYRF
jgi:hypothetical protein